MRAFGRLIGMAMGTALLAPVAVRAQTVPQTATQRVIFHVLPRRQGSVAAPTHSLAISPAGVAVDSASYTIGINAPHWKIAASLDRPLPRGVELAVELVAPPGAHARGITRLSTTTTDLVAGIAAVTATRLPVTYALTTERHVADAGAQTRTVTFTVVAGQ